MQVSRGHRHRWGDAGTGRRPPPKAGLRRRGCSRTIALRTVGVSASASGGRGCGYQRRRRHGAKRRLYRLPKAVRGGRAHRYGRHRAHTGQERPKGSDCLRKQRKRAWGQRGNSTQADSGGMTAVDEDVQLMKPGARFWTSIFAFTQAVIESWSR